MNTPIWMSVNGGENSQHIMIIASSRKGRSRLLEAEALRLGITYEELEHRLEPSAEEKEQMRMQRDAEEQLEEQRLQVVRQAIWDAWSDDVAAFSRIHDALVSTVMDDAPSVEQIKAIFMMLPATIIGGGISWGFTDSEVGDDIYQFIEENEDAIKAKLADTRK